MEKLVWPEDVSPIADFKPAFPVEAINEDIIRAAILAFAVMEGCIGKIADMGDKKLAQQRIVHRRIPVDTGWQANQLFAVKSVFYFRAFHE